MQPRHYHLILSDEERDSLVAAGRAYGRPTIHSPRIPATEAADRLERTPGEEDTLALSGNLLRAWYYGRVRELAKEALGNLLDGTLSDEEALSTWLTESIDGTDIVVYTYKAKAALLASDNEDAYQESMGEAPRTPEAAAFFALEADVREHLDAFASSPPEGVTLPDGFDLRDPETWTVRPETIDEAHGITVAPAAPAETGARSTEWDVFREGEHVSSHETRDEAASAAQDLADELDALRPLSAFIAENREKLRAAVLRACPNVGELADSDLADWIANDASLYEWARRDGIDVDGGAS